MASPSIPVRLSYEIVDVFTHRPFAGNPLAVVLGAEGLATGQLQALTNEFHLSETVFLLPATAPGASYRARIFMPGTELPFAGHPSIGVAVTAARLGRVTPDADGRLIQECGAGLLPVVLAPDRAGARLTGATPVVGPPQDPAPLLAAVGLPASAVVRPPRVAGCGLDFRYLEVAPEYVTTAALDRGAARRHGLGDICVFAYDAATRRAHARVFLPDLAAGEDPATGSAALGLGAYLHTAGLLSGDGDTALTVSQGAELGRPSTLHVTVHADGGAAPRITVAGTVVEIASGQIAVPPAGD